MRLPAALECRFAPLILFVAAASSVNAPHAQTPSAQPPVRIGVSEPVKDLTPFPVDLVTPDYPIDAARARLQGRVTLDITIDGEGNITNIVLLRTNPQSVPQLVQASLDAVKRWKYRPIIVNGAPIRVITTVEVIFTAAQASATGVSPSGTVTARFIFGDPGPTLLDNTPAGMIALYASGPELYEISVDRAAALPRWDGRGQAPLSMGEAVTAGEAWLKRRNPDLRLNTTSADLRVARAKPPALVDVWWYELKGAGYSATVLLDGSIVEPRILDVRRATNLPEPSTPQAPFEVVHAFALPGMPSHLIEGTDGNVFGTTAGGDRASLAIFRMAPTGEIATVHAFTGVDASGQVTALLRGRDGNFYGTTNGSGTGTGDLGTIFRMTAAGAVTVLHRFADADGGLPHALLQARDGAFYGATSLGGAFGSGTFFKIAPDGAFATVYSFPRNGNLAFPGDFVEARDGSFYGTAQNAIIRITAAGETTYGTTVRDGASRGGTIFKILVQSR